jgi:hypothetical protein
VEEVRLLVWSESVMSEGGVVYLFSSKSCPGTPAVKTSACLQSAGMQAGRENVYDPPENPRRNIRCRHRQIDRGDTLVEGDVA